MAPAETACSKQLDPRIRRTRELLQKALSTLLETRSFDDVSVQEITEAATVNRATFYAHYPDKFALLECLVAGRFHSLLEIRNVAFDGTCPSALQGIVLALCDYLAETPGACGERQRQLEPHLESAITAVIQNMVLYGLQQHPPANSATPELLAAMISWSMYGAVKNWLRTPDRPTADHLAKTVVDLLRPLFGTEAHHPEEEFPETSLAI
jgi:AcrR family transcriptional regulator